MACLRMGASARRARHVRSTATLCQCHVEHHNVQTKLLVFFFSLFFFFHFPSPLADLDAMHQTRLHCCRRNAYRHFQLPLSTSQLPVTHCAYICKARIGLLKMRMDSTSSSTSLSSIFFIAIFKLQHDDREMNSRQSTLHPRTPPKHTPPKHLRGSEAALNECWTLVCARAHNSRCNLVNDPIIRSLFPPLLFLHSHTC